MELSQIIAPEVLTDTVLNLVGYVTAGALCTMAYTAITGKGKPVKTRAAAIPAETPIELVHKDNIKRKSEFVSLKSHTTGSRSNSSRIIESTESRGMTLQQQRNRAEVIRLAREMLLSGTSKDNVRSLLPISDGELTMLLDKQRV
jgi:hypothetical protein